MYLTLKVAMTDRDAVERFYRIVGLGNVRGPYKWGSGNRQPIWLWWAISEPAFALVEEEGFMVHLCKRRTETIRRLVEEVRSQPPTLQQRRKDLTHCPQQHPYDEENTYVNPKGWRTCRTCRRDRKRRSPVHA